MPTGNDALALRCNALEECLQTRLPLNGTLRMRLNKALLAHATLPEAIGRKNTDKPDCYVLNLCLEGTDIPFKR